MGWCSGAELADNLWSEIEEYIPKEHLKKVARAFVEEFENFDCDTMMETEVGQVAGIINDEEEGSRWEWE